MGHSSHMLFRVLPPRRASFITGQAKQTTTAMGGGGIQPRHSPTIVRVHLKFAKCDQFGQGADVFIGQSGNAICPIAACLSYVAVRGDQPGPFFVKRDGRPMLKPDFVSELRRALTARGFDSLSFAGHSFRIGAATAAAAAGIEDSTIKALGRWSSDAFLSYIRTPGLQLAATSTSIARIVDR
eukprot:Em0008g235a